MKAVSCKPEIPLVNTKLDNPSAMAVTTPLFVIDATIGSELDHTPPVEGLRVEVDPAQRVSFPVMEIEGTSYMLMIWLLSDLQPVNEEVNITLKLPRLTDCISPALLMVAFAVLLLNQVPPDEGRA